MYQVRPLGGFPFRRRYAVCLCAIGTSHRLPYYIGFQIDAQTVLDHLLNHEVFSKTPIVGGCERYRRSSVIDQSFQILYGQSIGGAVSIDLASRNPEAVGSSVVGQTPSGFLTFTSHLDQSPHS